jgi:hypothetical protein
MAAMWGNLTYREANVNWHNVLPNNGYVIKFLNMHPLTQQFHSGIFIL